MKKLLFLFIILFVFENGFAQKIKFLNATEQHWVSGVCCSYGINYIIYLESNDTINYIHVDSVWVGEKLFVEKQKNKLSNFKIVRKGKTTYSIMLASSWDSNTSKSEEFTEHKSGIKPPKYSGKACLIYYTGKEKKQINVPRFLKLGTITYQ